MATMKAIYIERYGGPEVMTLADRPLPVARANEVRIKVQAAGVNALEWKVRDGLVQQHLPVSPPFILGADVSGIIDSVGPGVAAYKVGDEVFGQVGLLGGFAEYAVTASHRIAPKPASIDHVTAASVPIPAMTAWQGLFREGGLKQGQRVLIHAAAGGVGTFAVQFAHQAGAYVIGTASAANHDYVRSLGADEVIDYRTEPFETRARDLDMVFDLLSGKTQERSWALLKRGGVLVCTVGPPAPGKAEAHGVTGKFVIGAPDPKGEDLRRIADMLERGTLKTTIQAVFPMAEAVQAVELSKAGHIRGKIVLRIP